MVIVGTRVVFAEVNKQVAEREQNTATQSIQPTTSNDTYDHIEHCRLSQTNHPTESNYDTMHSIVNASQEENNYDHPTDTSNGSKQIVVEISTDSSHVRVCESRVIFWE